MVIVKKSDTFLLNIVLKKDKTLCGLSFAKNALMKSLIIKILFLTVCSVFTGQAFAAKEQVIKLTMKDPSGESFDLSLISYINHLKSQEVRIEARGLPRINKSINPLLGFGRDTDDNGKVDTWFFATKNGIELVQKEGNDPLGKDVLGSLLKQKYRSSFLMYVSSATTSLLGYFFMAANEGKNVNEQFFKDYMDLEENRLNFEKNLELMRTSVTREQMQFHYEMTSLGFKEIANRMDSFAKKGFWGYALADIGLWISGSYIIKWVGAILYKTGLIASEVAFINTLKETFIGFFEKQKANLGAKVAAMNEKMGLNSAFKNKNAATKTAFVLTTKTWREALTGSIKISKFKNKLLAGIITTAKFPVKITVAAAKEWKYIALGTGIQLGSEAYARYDDIKDPNPFVAGQNLLSNSEVQQNVAYMTTETVLMTGISKNLKTTKAKFLASGAVALTNSSILNLAIKDNPDMKRMALDTGWEMIIGNAQVQLDLKSLEYFEKMSLKKNNPKLKLVGYAVVLVNTAVGYVVYSKATSAIDKKPEDTKVTPMLVPILAEAS